MSHKIYSVNELVHDQSFRRMVNGATSLYKFEKWTNWIEESDQNRTKATSAMSAIIGFKFRDPEFPDIEIKWNDLSAKTRGSKSNHSKNSNEVLGGYHFNQNDEAVNYLEQLVEIKTITTGDEQKILRFSNGSKVILRDNSTLTYKLGLIQGQKIDVELEDEALFDVKSYSSKDKTIFAVATPDEVIGNIGTKYLVNVQKGHTRVVLHEQLSIILSKNQYGYLDLNGSSMNVDDLAVENYFAWKSGWFNFEELTMHRFCTQLNRIYNIYCRFTDELIPNIYLTARFSKKSMEKTLEVIMLSLEFEFEMNDNVVSWSNAL